ncbi:ABC transporter substrate-binding protein [Paenibacillus pectinilyticus]|uniref:ABC transporter substrate-binding protein n=1 Tax=Paenibacillus pectinilyticus TaxID=512399 RepID=UPI00114D17DF|nr:ABC transporter substrate-binding protein [Paenibacillus pectinilyticus]
MRKDTHHRRYEYQKIVADQLSKIAPIVFQDEAKMDVWNDWLGVMTKFGEMLGQEDVAKQAILMSL